MDTNMNKLEQLLDFDNHLLGAAFSFYILFVAFL